jgi:RNA polymerase sigma-70 factor (ECF subfamily)
MQNRGEGVPPFVLTSRDSAFQALSVNTKSLRPVLSSGIGANQEWRYPLGSRVQFGWGMGPTMVSAGRVPNEPMENEVVSLVAAAREGDRGAFGRLYERYARMVHGILLGRVPVAEVEDLVQDVFVRAMRQVHTLRDVNCFGGWLATVARNRANDYHRRSVEVVEFTEQAPQGAVRRATAASLGDGAAILQLIRDLPEAYRETLLMRLVEGMTGPEIAERTGLTPGSVRVNLHRGMQMLREKLETKV